MNTVLTERKNWHEENLKKVTDALFEMGARSLAQVKGPNRGGTLEFFAMNGKVVIVQAYANESGLEVWCPLTASMKMTDVVEAVKVYMQNGPPK
jgi:hypothetical protein